MICSNKKKKTYLQFIKELKKQKQIKSIVCSSIVFLEQKGNKSITKIMQQRKLAIKLIFR